MTHRRAVSGWLVLDKSADMRSSRAVGTARHLFNATKAGHAGTLDETASGLLAIAFGEATKTVAFLMRAQKAYRFRLRWGIGTDTLDAAGAVIAESSARPTRARLARALAGFVGVTRQVPPDFSAVKLNGRRAWQLARAGVRPQIRARDAYIAEARLLSHDGDDSEIDVTCGKGVYIRALARDMGDALQVPVHVAALRRTRLGPFGLEDAYALNALKEMAGFEPLDACLRPLESVLGDVPVLSLDAEDAARVRQGQSVPARAGLPEGEILARDTNAPVALAHIAEGVLRPTRVFNLAPM